MIIDSHQHFWDRSLAGFDYSWQEADELRAICRDFLPCDLKPHLNDAGIDGTVLVQTQHKVLENQWSLQLADQFDFIKGVVGWVDLASEQCESQLLQVKDHPKFVGVRHVIQDEPDDNFVLRDDVSRGLATLEKHGVPFDLLFYARHLHHAPRVAERFPDLPLVIDHLSKPNIKAGSIDQWKRELQAAARHENVFCKLSGMVTEADWTGWKFTDLKPYADVALDCFGPERLMYGSDWPVCELAATYDQVKAVTDQLIGELTDSERAMIMGETATRFYGLA